MVARRGQPVKRRQRPPSAIGDESSTGEVVVESGEAVEAELLRPEGRSSPPARPPGRSIEVVIDIHGQPTIRVGVLERLAQEDFVDGLGRRLDATGAGEIFLEGLADKVGERHPPRAGRLDGLTVKLPGQQKLSPVHA